MTHEYVYRRFERFWHWTQAALILFLGVTGFEIHGSLSFFGFDQAVRYHSAAAMAFLVLIAFAIFWHFTTGEWRQYVPTARTCGRRRSTTSSASSATRRTRRGRRC